MIRSSRKNPIVPCGADAFAFRAFVWLLFFHFLLLPGFLISREKLRFGTVQKKGEILVFDFDAGDLMNDQIFNGLRRGMTAAVEYQSQLCRVMPRWIDQTVHETTVRLKIHYDAWEKKYAVELGRDKVHWLDENSARSRCTMLVEFPAGPAAKLRDGERYYITLRILLKPMSVENTEEISQWLGGEVRELDTKSLQSSKSPGKKAGGWFLSLLLNLTGFGDRIISSKSRPFTWHEGSVIQEEEPAQ